MTSFTSASRHIFSLAAIGGIEHVKGRAPLSPNAAVDVVEARVLKGAEANTSRSLQITRGGTELLKVGYNNQCLSGSGLVEPCYPLGPCEGDCNADSDCEYGLICSSGDDYDSTNIPGCIGLPGISSYDYCSHGGIWLQMVGDANKPPELFPLDVCQGDCDNDDECKDGLICIHRGNSDDSEVPGCIGGSLTQSWIDYCSPGGIYLHQVGDNGSPQELYPLSDCLGDCDSDSDCQEGLVCFERNGGEDVPGCIGGSSDTTDTDYCSHGGIWIKKVGDDGFPTEFFPLDVCQGDCDNDDECKGDLVCLKRNGGDEVPGCIGGSSDTTGKDYCYGVPTSKTLHPCHPSWSWDNSYLYGAQVSIENTTTSPDQWTQCDPNDPLEYDCSEAGLKNAGGRTTTIRRNYRCVNEGYYWEQPGTPMGNFGWILERECDSLPLPTNFVRISHYYTKRYLITAFEEVTTNVDAPSQLTNSLTLQRYHTCPTAGYYAEKGLTSPCYLIIWEGHENRRLYAMTGQSWGQGFGVRKDAEITSEDIWFIEKISCEQDIPENGCAMLRNALNGRTVYNNPDPEKDHIVSASPGNDYEFHWTTNEYIWYFEDLNTNTSMDVSPWATNTMFTRVPNGATTGVTHTLLN